MVCLLTSCSKQEYPAKPFVYENKIVVEKGNTSNDEKKRLELALQNYWDDSLLTRKVQQFGFFYRLKNPPAFDTIYIPRTKAFMNGYLKSQGYFYTDIRASYDTTIHKDQKRVKVTMNVNTGKATIIDSLAYNFSDSTAQYFAMRGLKQSLIKPGTTRLSKDDVGAELDRLVDTFKLRGYYKMNREHLVSVADTMDVALLQQVIDPFQLAEIISNALKKRRENPTADLVIQERRNADSSLVDSSAFRRFYSGHIYYYPETGVYDIFDSLINNPSFKRLDPPDTNAITIFYNQGKFHYRPLRKHSYIRQGQPYNERTFFKTLNNLSQIGAWRQVDARTVERGDTIDYHIFLVPYPKQNITFDLEASRNTGDLLGSNNLFGLSLNSTYRNRNLLKRAIQASTSFRNGIELNLGGGVTSSLLQTFQSSLSQTFAFPEVPRVPSFLQKFLNLQPDRADGVKTIINATGSYSERSDYFRLRSLNFSYGWEWINRRTRVWQIKPVNLEFYGLDSLDLLNRALASNPYLKNAFNTGNIISMMASRTYTAPSKRNPNITNYLRLSAEWAGHILGLIKNLQNDIYQYIKLEAEVRKNIKFRKTSLALRAFGGFGINYSSDPLLGQTLPFYKQFIGGGPNSMRAWTLRQLGLGSNIASDTIRYKDRYGDLQLEANIEYRFPLAVIGGVNIGSALFTDIGNVWNVRKNPGLPDANFDLRRLGKDIAIGVGTGLRFDFNYFLIRIDMGIKLKDPARLTNNGWLDFSDFTWRNKEKIYKDNFGVINRNNYAIQLGINLPF